MENGARYKFNEFLLQNGKAYNIYLFKYEWCSNENHAKFFPKLKMHGFIYIRYLQLPLDTRNFKIK